MRLESRFQLYILYRSLLSQKEYREQDFVVYWRFRWVLEILRSTGTQNFEAVHRVAFCDALTLEW